MAHPGPTETLRWAQELRSEFNNHALLETRRAVVGRDMPPKLEELGFAAKLQDVLPWQTDRPNQEAHAFATLLSLAKPVVEVFAQSEAPNAKRKAEALEDMYSAMIDILIPDDYEVGRHMAMDGFAVRRLDERGRFFKGPKRDENEDGELFNERVDEHRREIGLPFEVVGVDPSTFYYEEDRRRQDITFAVEFRTARESEVLDDGDFGTEGELLIVGTPDVIHLWWLPEGEGGSEQLVFEGENRFGHTGYFLYRGRYTGFSGRVRRYEPFIESTLNLAQPLSLFMTLQSVFAVQAGMHWLESDLPRMLDNQSRQVSVERKTKGRGAAPRTEHGQAAAEFEPGISVRFRELAGDYRVVVETLLAEFDLYRVKDVLMGEASADASGRAIIRLQEAAGRQLSAGYRARKLATEQMLRVMRRTLFGRPEYLGGDGNTSHIFIPRLVEGNATERNREDVIRLGADDNIPHEIRVDVSALSQAAQLAWMEEGLKMEGILSRDSIDQDFYRIKNIPLENRRRTKDQMRSTVMPVAIQDGAEKALLELGKRPVQRGAVVVGDNGAAPGPQGISGQPTPPQTEDVGTALGVDQGVGPAPEG